MLTFVGSLSEIVILTLIDETKGIDSLLDGTIRRTLTATWTSYISRIKKLFLVIHRAKSTYFTKQDAALHCVATSCSVTICIYMPFTRH